MMFSHNIPSGLTLCAAQTWPLRRDHRTDGVKAAALQLRGAGDALGDGLGDASGEASGDASGDGLGDVSGEMFVA